MAWTRKYFVLLRKYSFLFTFHKLMIFNPFVYMHSQGHHTKYISQIKAHFPYSCLSFSASSSSCTLLITLTPPQADRKADTHNTQIIIASPACVLLLRTIIIVHSPHHPNNLPSGRP